MRRRRNPDAPAPAAAAAGSQMSLWEIGGMVLALGGLVYSALKSSPAPAADPNAQAPTIKLGNTTFAPGGEIYTDATGGGNMPGDPQFAAGSRPTTTAAPQISVLNGIYDQW